MWPLLVSVVVQVHDSLWSLQAAYIALSALTSSTKYSVACNLLEISTRIVFKPVSVSVRVVKVLLTSLVTSLEVGEYVSQWLALIDWLYSLSLWSDSLGCTTALLCSALRMHSRRGQDEEKKT